MMGWVVAGILVVVAVRFAFEPEIRACRERDPAARSSLEIILTYAGLHALVAYRLAHALHRLGVPVVPRLITHLARWMTGIEIHPAATIGRGLFIDHGMGVVIGETSVLGENVTLFQGVTLGGTGKQRGKRHPTLGDRVVVGAGAKVLGAITIGSDSMIGANAVVIRDVPAQSTVVGVPGRIAKIQGQQVPASNLDHTHLPDPIAQRLARLQEEIHALERHLKEPGKAQPPSPQ